MSIHIGPVFLAKAGRSFSGLSLHGLNLVGSYWLHAYHRPSLTCLVQRIVLKHEWHKWLGWASSWVIHESLIEVLVGSVPFESTWHSRISWGELFNCGTKGRTYFANWLSPAWILGPIITRLGSDELWPEHAYGHPIIQAWTNRSSPTEFESLTNQPSFSSSVHIVSSWEVM